MKRARKVGRYALNFSERVFCALCEAGGWEFERLAEGENRRVDFQLRAGGEVFLVEVKDGSRCFQRMVETPRGEGPGIFLKQVRRYLKDALGQIEGTGVVAPGMVFLFSANEKVLPVEKVRCWLRLALERRPSLESADCEGLVFPALSALDTRAIGVVVVCQWLPRDGGLELCAVRNEASRRRWEVPRGLDRRWERGELAFA